MSNRSLNLAFITGKEGWEQSHRVDLRGSSFVELRDISEGGSGVEIKMQKLTISLSREFDKVTLKRCLQLLLELSC